MLRISLLISLLTLFACSSKKSRPSENYLFKVKPDRVLFFKNVRQIYYDIEDQKATGLILYRHHQRCKDQNKTCLSLTIVHNWRYDEAYLLIELNDLMVRNLHLQFKTKDSVDSINMAQIKKEEYIELAKKIGDFVRQKTEIALLEAEKSPPVLDTEKEKDIYLTILKDYLDLVK
jgi:hypothetical protein